MPGLDFWVQRWKHSSGMEDELVLGSSDFSLVFFLAAALSGFHNILLNSLMK